MELGRYKDLLGRRLLLVVIAALVGLGAGWATTSSSAPSFQSSVTVFVDQSGSGPGPAASDAASFDQLLSSYCVLFPDAASAQAAVSSAGLPRSPGVVQSETTVAAVPATDLLKLTVSDPSSAVSARIATAMGTELARVISSGASGLASAPAKVVTTAVTSATAPSSRKRRVAEDGALGLLVGAVLVVAFGFIEGRIRRVDEIEERLGLPILAVIPRDRSTAGRRSG